MLGNKSGKLKRVMSLAGHGGGVSWPARAVHAVGRSDPP